MEHLWNPWSGDNFLIQSLSLKPVLLSLAYDLNSGRSISKSLGNWVMTTGQMTWPMLAVGTDKG